MATELDIITASVAVKVEDFSLVFVGIEHQTDGITAILGVTLSYNYSNPKAIFPYSSSLNII